MSVNELIVPWSAGLCERSRGSIYLRERPQKNKKKNKKERVLDQMEKKKKNKEGVPYDQVTTRV